MKLDQLTNLIRKEVRAAVREEVQDVIIEAVKIASTPTKAKPESTGYQPVKQKDISQTWSTGKMNSGTVPIKELLNQTKVNMTGDDYKNVINANSGMVQKPNFAESVATQMNMSAGNQPVLDLSQLDFVQKAKAVLDKSYEKDRNR